MNGCSLGIGFATALELARAGHQVLATIRHPEGAPLLRQTAASEKLPIKVLPLDVDSDESVSSCFHATAEPTDALVNNAGIEVQGSDSLSASTTTGGIGSRLRNAAVFVARSTLRKIVCVILTGCFSKSTSPTADRRVLRGATLSLHQAARSRARVDRVAYEGTNERAIKGTFLARDSILFLLRDLSSPSIQIARSELVQGVCKYHSERGRRGSPQ